jgi:PST family polysaccharide transporter
LGVLQRSRFARNWSYLVGANLFSQAVGMLATIRIARALAPEGYGQFNLVVSLAALGTQLVGLGLRDVIIRECARHPEKSGQIFLAGSVMRAVALAVVGAGIVAYGALHPAWLPGQFVAIAIALLVGQAVWALIENVAFGHERMEHASAITLAGSLLWVVVAWGVPGAWLTPVSVSLAFTVLQIGKVVAFARTTRQFFRSPTGGHATTWRTVGVSLLAASLPFFWFELMSTADNLLPVLILAARSGEAELGLYNAGFRLVYPITTLIFSALLALYPSLSRDGTGDSAAFMQTVRRALMGIIVAATMLAVGVSLLRYEVVLLLFGADFRGAADAMAFQCWFIVLFSIFSVMGTVFAARDKQGWMAWLATTYTAVAAPLIWWGAGHGATGLASATLLAAVLNMTYHWAVFQRSLPEPLPTRFGLSGLAIVLGGMAITLLVPATWPFLARLVLAAGFVSLVFLGALRQWQQRRTNREALREIPGAALAK